MNFRVKEIETESGPLFYPQYQTDDNLNKWHDYVYFHHIPELPSCGLYSVSMPPIPFPLNFKTLQEAKDHITKDEKYKNIVKIHPM